MFRRRDTLLLIGVATVAIGGWLFLHPYQDEALWIGWLLAPILVFLGLLSANVGALGGAIDGEAADATDSGQLPDAT